MMRRRKKKRKKKARKERESYDCQYVDQDSNKKSGSRDRLKLRKR